jgi:hypothetical protein
MVSDCIASVGPMQLAVTFHVQTIDQIDLMLQPTFSFIDQRFIQCHLLCELVVGSANEIGQMPPPTACRFIRCLSLKNSNTSLVANIRNML